jgi:hypothetical protein
MIDEQNSSISEDNVIVHKVVKNIVNIPECNDDKLIKDVNEFIINFYKENKSYNVFERRRKFFILDNLSSFSQENINNYKTEKTKPISDVLIDLKINSKVLEENMRICRNNNPNVTDFYMLIYYNNEAYTVRLINLKYNQPASEEISFTYNTPIGNKE